MTETANGSFVLHGSPTRNTLDDEAHLRAQVTFLRRKLQYLQSISTVFRQKIALIMRECSKNPQSFPEYHRMYAKVLGEVTRAETEFASSDPADTKSPQRQKQDTAEAKKKDDVIKAHQLCLVLQEKNDLKKKEVELRRQVEEIQKKYDELCERHNKLVELSSSGAGADQAQHELYTQRVEELEKALLETRGEIMRLQHALSEQRRGGSTTSGETGSAGGGIFDFLGNEHNALLKQNNMLKARCNKLKEELSNASQEHLQSTKEMQKNIDQLATEVNHLKGELESRTYVVRQAQTDKIEVSKELILQRKTEELLRAKIAALENEVETLAKSDPLPKPQLPRAVEQKKIQSSSDAEAQLAEALKEIDRLENKIREMSNTARQKDVEIASMGAQIKSFRARIDHIEAMKEQTQMQQTMVQDVHSRLMGAVQDIKNSQTTQLLSQQMSEINNQLQRLESLELQLRQKEDLLAVAEDELAQIKASNMDLQHSLGAVSGLFLQLPRSVDALERLVIERDEYKAEVQRSTECRELPDLVEVEGRVELRCLEVETARRAHRAEIDRQLEAAPPTSLEAQELLGTLGSYSPGGAAEDMDDPIGDSLLLPPPPPLVNITSGHTDADALRMALGGPASPVGGSQFGRSPGSAERQGKVSEDDVRLTFQLFDDQGTGVLPIDVIRLCLTTLGLSPSLAPAQATSMTASEFIALCARRSLQDSSKK